MLGLNTLGLTNAQNAELQKIDLVPTDGLLGVENSLAYEIKEADTHIHSHGRFLEQAAVPNGEIHVADRIGDGIGAFRLDAGNDDWGAWVQILGSSDTPIDAGMAKYDLHRIAVAAAERNATYFLQFGFDESGAAALASGSITDEIFTPVGNQGDSGPAEIQNERHDAGVKAWARTKCPGQDTATFDFYPGVHEYPG